MGSGKGGSILANVGANNADKEGITTIVKIYRQLVRRAKQTRVEQIIPSGILQVMGSRGQGYRHFRRMAMNPLFQQLCREEKVGFVDMWGCFVWRADMYMRDGLHLMERVQQCLLMNYQQQSTVAREA